MRQMKDSGYEYVGQIPSDWSFSKFKYVGVFSKGKITSTSNDEGIGFPIIGASEMLGKAPRLYTPEIGCMLDESDFVVLWDGANAGIVAGKLSGVVSSTASRYRLHCCSLDYGYTLYNLKTAEPYFKSRVNGTTIPHMNPTYIDEFPVLLPSVEEQKAIAAFLDEKCAEIDGLLSDIKAEIDVLADYKKSIISEAVTHGLNPSAPMKLSGIEWIGDVPQSWELRKAKYMFIQRNTRGNMHNLELLSPSQKFGVIPQSMLEGVVLMKEDTDLASLKTIHKGDFCISLRSFQGGFEYSNYEGVVSPAYQVFYPTIDVCDGYYKYLFKTVGFISKINTFSMSLRDGKNIAFADFGNMYLPIPPIEEQKAIADYLDDQCKHIDEVIQLKQEQLDKLTEYKASVIYEYVTGKKQVI